MSIVNLTNVVVHNNPGTWDSEFQFQIEFEVLSHLDDEIEWRLTYVGSTESASHDQVLDSVLVGPMAPGAYQIIFQADPPDIALIPTAELLGVTGLLLSCHYREEPFVQVGYYVRVEYDTPELNDEPPETPMRERITRMIAADQPRVTRYQIDWAAGNPALAAQMTTATATTTTPGVAGDALTPAAAGVSTHDGDADMSDGMMMMEEQAVVTTPPANAGAMSAADRLMGVDMMMEGAAADKPLLQPPAALVGTEHMVSEYRLDANVPPMPLVGLP